MNNSKFTFIVTPEGKLPLGIAKHLTQILSELAGKKATIELKESKQKRGCNANRYYWGVIVCTVRAFLLEQGQAKSLEDVHEELIAVYSPTIEIIGFDGRGRFVPMRSSKMDKDQFYKYCLNIESALATYGVVLPARDYYND
jgi:hypothetical protein